MLFKTKKQKLKELKELENKAKKLFEDAGIDNILQENITDNEFDFSVTKQLRQRFHDLANRFLQHGENEKAIKVLQRAYFCFSCDAYINFNLAILYLSTNPINGLAAEGHLFAALRRADHVWTDTNVFIALCYCDLVIAAVAQKMGGDAVQTLYDKANDYVSRYVYVSRDKMVLSKKEQMEKWMLSLDMGESTWLISPENKNITPKLLMPTKKGEQTNLCDCMMKLFCCYGYQKGNMSYPPSQYYDVSKSISELFLVDDYSIIEKEVDATRKILIESYKEDIMQEKQDKEQGKSKSLAF